MSPSLDRDSRLASNKRKDAAQERRNEKEAKKEKKKASRNRKSERKSYTRSSAAHYETRSLLKTMGYSAGILIIAFCVFEGLLLVYKSMAGDDYSQGDMYWHLINIADTCVGFVIGLTAMDALTYANQNQRNKREEQRAIIRHNRIVRPCIDMYLARKNGLVTADGEEFKQFQIVTDSKVRDLKDMYGPSIITSDAGKQKIEVFYYYHKKLYNALLNMAEDIDFDYNPEVCDAVMEFLNESTYGMAALDAVASYGKEGNRTQKMSVIRQVKEAPDNLELSDITNTELNTVFILMHMIHAHEEALDRYLRVIGEIDNDSARRMRKMHR